MKNHIKIFYFAAGIILFFSGKSFAEEKSFPQLGVTTGSQVVGKTAAIVNNEPIFLDEFEKETIPFIDRYKKTVPEKEQSEEKISELKKEILNRLIEEKLLLQESKNRKIKINKVEIERGVEQFKEPFHLDEQGKPRTPAQVEKSFQDQLIKEGMTQEQFTHRVEEQLMKVKLIDLDIRSKVVLPKDEEVKKFFEKIQNKMAGKAVIAASPEEENDLNQLSKYLERVTGEQIRIRHILIRAKKGDDPSFRNGAKKKLENIAQKITKGEDFAFLAKKYSEEPISKERGGDLGFIAKGDLGLPSMDEAIFKLKEGEVSKIIETEFGFHLCKLIEKKAPHTLEYEDVSDDLKNFIAQREFTQKLEKYLKELRVKANIKVNPI
ncbi:MAG: hypothetical protein A3I11_00075 [Elusimicrobia bacterium RIFCSPLOWO2_02_FULL_39_32]|nr:MAG: hypothetical protein A3B80_04505 [Elusimicrobia bacterium RIFCSPHIGHO2_02_FULL_39_36]OGR93302.1 MAG: hypothetical protein A3I11_00075 [Elusimicrobia bacterium RIFCSPLOWO2_02_FULL_39_32]OGS00532.1 MAG: hypothetical protein A3G85_00475 [Elusimicrobia bacterium RIFCSPLOWO2_12_FULL_39_28]